MLVRCRDRRDPKAATGANGGVLEGTINLAMELGEFPDQIYLAVGVYGNGDGGALVPAQQVPATANGNGNIDAVEYFLLQFIATPGDFTSDGKVDSDDYKLWRSTFGSSDLRADGNGDTLVNVVDCTIWR